VEDGMKTLLMDGFSDAYRNLGAALRLFWPQLVIFVLVFAILILVGNFQYKTDFSTEPVLSLIFFILIFGIWIYLFLILCQSAVGWHRRLLLHEKAQWMSPIPRRRSLQYALPAVLFLAVTLVGLALMAYFLLPYLGSALLAKAQEIGLGSNPTIEQYEAFRKATILINLAMQLCVIVLAAVIIWGGRSWLLAFPHVSVRNSQPVWGAVKDSVQVPSGFVGALLAALFLPTVVGFLFQSAVPISIQMMPWVGVVVFLVNLVLSVLSFLASLSILSLAYAKAVAGKVYYTQSSEEPSPDDRGPA
jgi:hypothetical protein